jgi:predicted dinucleotide-binding enzyme
MMKISILGAGNVGGTLGRAWAGKGHDVFFGVPIPEDAKTQEFLTTIGSKARAGTVAEAAAAGEVIVLATPWPATRGAIQAAGNLAARWWVGTSTSAAEEIVKRAPRCQNGRGHPADGANPGGRLPPPRWAADKCLLLRQRSCR